MNEWNEATDKDNKIIKKNILSLILKDELINNQIIIDINISEDWIKFKKIWNKEKVDAYGLKKFTILQI